MVVSGAICCITCVIDQQIILPTASLSLPFIVSVSGDPDIQRAFTRQAFYRKRQVIRALSAESARARNMQIFQQQVSATVLRKHIQSYQTIAERFTEINQMKLKLANQLSKDLVILLAQEVRALRKLPVASFIYTTEQEDVNALFEAASQAQPHRVRQRQIRGQSGGIGKCGWFMTALALFSLVIAGTKINQNSQLMNQVAQLRRQIDIITQQQFQSKHQLQTLKKQLEMKRNDLQTCLREIQGQIGTTTENNVQVPLETETQEWDNEPENAE